MTTKSVVENAPEITRIVREQLAAAMAGAARTSQSRERQALDLIARRAQTAGPEDAEDALTYIYQIATEVAQG